MTQYRIQHATPKQPQFKLYVNGKATLLGQILNLPESRQIFIQILNIGNETATGLEINMGIALDPTNMIISLPWQHLGEQQTVGGNVISTYNGFHVWQIRDVGGTGNLNLLLTNGVFDATTFNISTNATHPLFTMKQIKDFGFTFNGDITKQFPDIASMPYMPIEISVYSSETFNPTVFIFFVQY